MKSIFFLQVSDSFSIRIAFVPFGLTNVIVNSKWTSAIAGLHNKLIRSRPALFQVGPYDLSPDSIAFGIHVQIVFDKNTRYWFSIGAKHTIPYIDETAVLFMLKVFFY